MKQRIFKLVSPSLALSVRDVDGLSGATGARGRIAVTGIGRK
jgi:hypothetical protein